MNQTDLTLPTSEITPKEWTIEHDGFVSNLAAALCQSANSSNEDKLPDTFEAPHTILGVELCYRRINTMQDNLLVRHDYEISGKGWKLNMSFDPTTRPTKDMLDSLTWTGTGDYERWQKDAVILKVSGECDDDVPAAVR